MNDIESISDVLKRTVTGLTDPDHDYAEDTAVGKLEKVRKFLVSPTVSGLANRNSDLHLVRRELLQFINAENVR